MSSFTKFDLVNRALDRTGNNTIADFEGGSVESEVSGREYEALVEERLTGTFPDGGSIEWRFCMELADLGPPLVDTPADKWSKAYNLPADLLVIRAVRRNGGPIPFDRYGAKIMCDADTGVVLEYTFRQVESAFPGYFRAGLISELASVFAVALNRDLDLGKFYRKEADGLWLAARFADSKGRTAETFKSSRVVSARR